MKTVLFKFCEGTEVIPFVREEHEVDQLDKDKIQKLIDCRVFTHDSIVIDSKEFDVLVDKEGILDEKPLLCFNNTPCFAGNILFVGKADKEGNIMDLTENQLRILNQIPRNNLSFITVY